MRSVQWWLGQLIPRTFWTNVERPEWVGEGNIRTIGGWKPVFVIWKMWLGRCYDVAEVAA